MSMSSRRRPRIDVVGHYDFTCPHHAGRPAFHAGQRRTVTEGRMSFQFAHMESWSRSGGRGGKLTVAEIVAEARRDPAASLHVESPRPPAHVYGCGLDDLEQRHDAVVDAARETLANGKQRAIRKDTATLFTCILSHPATPDECRSDPEAKATVKAWAQDSVKWLRRDLEARGGTLESVVMHTDESHIHLHAYALHPSGHADRLHPGKLAKKDAVAAALDSGHDKKAANAIGDKAYVESLRGWQDSYSQDVGLPHGLTRLGPARRRLSRAEWMAEQAAAKSVQQARTLAKAATDAANTADDTRHQILEDAHKKALLAASEANRKLQTASRAEAIAKESAITAQQVIEKAHQHRNRILSDAHRDLGRLRSFGMMLRTFWDSLRASAIRQRVRKEVQVLIDRETEKAASALRRLRDESSRRMVVETRLADAIRSARSLGRERDELRRDRDRRVEQVSVALPENRPNFP